MANFSVAARQKRRRIDNESLQLYSFISSEDSSSGNETSLHPHQDVHSVRGFDDNLAENITSSSSDEIEATSNSDHSESVNILSESECLSAGSSEEDSERVVKPFDVGLVNWKHENHIRAAAVNRLLAHLKTVPDLSYLPSDCRTLVKTPRKINFKDVSGGQYFHFGIERAVRGVFVSNKHRVFSNEISIHINVDGLPLCKSSGSQFWCILGLMPHLYSNIPFVIGIYHGLEKPKDSNQFMEDFVDEAMRLNTNGFYFENNLMRVVLKGILCDAPAKAFILFIKGHTSHNGCTKCSQKGIHVGGRSVFPEVNPGERDFRTNETFREKLDEDHHNGDSILENLDYLDMVSDVPLDYMHLVCLGVMKKLMQVWVPGTKKSLSPMFKLSRVKTEELDAALLRIQKYIPREFARKCRSTNESNRFKATEWRLILLYVGPIVFKSVLPSSLYFHFILLHISIKILSQPSHSLELNNYAGSLLNYFVKECENLYGQIFMSYNIHNLLHLAKDVERFGNLDSFSCFVFENKLQELKKLVVKNDKPLAQIARRLIERENFTEVKGNNQKEGIVWRKKHAQGPLTNNCCGDQYGVVKYNHFTFGCFTPDNCLILNDSTVILARNFIKTDGTGDPVVIGQRYTDVSDFFSDYDVIDSRDIFTFKVSKLPASLECRSFNDIKCKGFKVPLPKTSRREDKFHLVQQISMEDHHPLNY